MAVAVLGHFNDCELTNNNDRVMKTSRRLDRRHYKKDSRFVLDLYTLTYDSHESLDSLGDLTDVSIFSFRFSNWHQKYQWYCYKKKKKLG